MKERKGAASLYVVIFATILFGVITLSFIRIILSESVQTMNDDLSQSAYDAALAGVEDAKIAVNRYYQCLSSGGDYESCGGSNIFKPECEDAITGENKIGLAYYLYDNYDGGEIKIQEETTSGTNGVANGTEQAYTCVTISDTTEDYRSTLTSDTRTRVVPIVIGSTLSDIGKIEFSWYSENNGTVFSNLDNGGKFSDKDHSTTPPVISLSVLATGQNININDFNSDSNYNFSTSILLPSSYISNDDPHLSDLQNARDNRDGSFNPESSVVATANTINSSTLIYNATANSGINNPFLARCTHSEFACNVTLEVQNYLQSAAGPRGNLLLVVSMPYGDTVTDFMVKVTTTSGQTKTFDGAQIKVDSTGRANQLVRRVESRLDPADIFFPYPQFALELNNPDDEALKKAFWITANCWTERGYCNNNGDINL